MCLKDCYVNIYFWQWVTVKTVWLSLSKASTGHPAQSWPLTTVGKWMNEWLNWWTHEEWTHSMPGIHHSQSQPWHCGGKPAHSSTAILVRRRGQAAARLAFPTAPLLAWDRISDTEGALKREGWGKASHGWVGLESSSWVLRGGGRREARVARFSK